MCALDLRQVCSSDAFKLLPRAVDWRIDVLSLPVVFDTEQRRSSRFRSCNTVGERPAPCSFTFGSCSAHRVSDPYDANRRRFHVALCPFAHRLPRTVATRGAYHSVNESTPVRLTARHRHRAFPFSCRLPRTVAPSPRTQQQRECIDAAPAHRTSSTHIPYPHTGVPPHPPFPSHHEGLIANRLTMENDRSTLAQ